jgi:hypothetical protein
MEVLISIFVAAVGLLGLAALIPVGRYNVLEASKNDRAASVARAAFREIKTRGLLKPEMWMNFDPTDDPGPQAWISYYKYDAGSPQSLPFGPLQFGNSLCLDPLLVAREAMNSSLSPGLPQPAGTGWLGQAFPPPLINDPPSAPRMARGTIRAWLPLASGNPPPMLGYFNPPNPAAMYAAADRIFRSGDDLVFSLDSDETRRSQPVWSDGRLQSNGDYSWLVTVSPLDATGSTKTVTASVVVFYKRNLVVPKASRGDGPPTERYVFADLLSGGIGWGGGDVRLRLPDPNATPNTSPEESDFPLVKPNTWLMLSYFVNDPKLANIVTPAIRPVFQWYRIVSVSRRADEQNGPEFMDNTVTATPSGQNEWYYDVTLSGPDLNASLIGLASASPPPAIIDADNILGAPTGYPTVFAALFENVVGVYTKTIEVDSWAMP